ncbi:hypothetical protein H6F88_28245 [Oculatella sp. FACHB-28]|nr:hypothetical protein [Oculatella sp. FACHB-28]
MPYCPLDEEDCTVYLQQVPSCPLREPECPWNKRRFPRPGFKHETEELDSQLQNALDTFDRDTDLTETITQVRHTISLNSVSIVDEAIFYEKDE